MSTYQPPGLMSSGSPRLTELAAKPYLTQRALAMFNGSVELARAWIGADPKRERRVLFEISIRKCQGRQTTAKYEAMQHAVALWVAEETAERENVQTAEDRMMLAICQAEAEAVGDV